MTKDIERQIAELEKYADSQAAREEIQRPKLHLEEGRTLAKSPGVGQDAWQRVLLARHPDRPYTLDFVEIFEDRTRCHDH